MTQYSYECARHFTLRVYTVRTRTVLLRIYNRTLMDTYTLTRSHVESHRHLIEALLTRLNTPQNNLTNSELQRLG